MNRRHFIKASGLGILLTTIIGSACKEDKKMPSEIDEKSLSKDPCSDISQLSETELKVRTALSYVAVSPYEDQVCDNCQFWIAAKNGEACGGCVSVKGPIHPKGYCSYWAP